MQLNETGKLAEKYWLEIPKHFPYVEFANHIVMPNHIHGILIIDKLGYVVKNDNSNENGYGFDENRHDSNENRHDSDEYRHDSDVETRLIASLPPPPTTTTTTTTTTTPSAKPKTTGGITGDYNPMLHESISRILRWYKGRCSFETHKINKGFDWQERFHDHIIRNAESFVNIQNYIADNPKNWKEDKFHM
jgi:REP element-mobilizing transposase RayT